MVEIAIENQRKRPITLFKIIYLISEVNNSFRCSFIDFTLHSSGILDEIISGKNKNIVGENF